MYNVLNMTFKDIILQNKKIPFQLGYIDPNTKYLTNINSESFNLKVIEGEADIFLSDPNYIIPYTTGTIVFELTYQGISNFISIYVVPARMLPQQVDIIKLLYKYLPRNCYTSDVKSVNYTKLFASAYVLAKVYFDNTYTNMVSLFDDIFPPLSTSQLWENNLNNGLPWTNSFDYAHVIQVVKNIRTYSSSTYNCCRQISEYLWYRYQVQAFVTIVDNNTPYAGKWVLGTSQLGISTVLDTQNGNLKSAIVYIQYSNPAFFTPSVIADISNFITKLFPVDVDFGIQVLPSFVSLGLTILIEDTYPFDPRLFGLFAIQYMETGVYKTWGLVSPYNPEFVTGFEIQPANGTFAPNSPSFPLTAIIHYSYAGQNYTQDVTTYTLFSSSNSNIMSVSGNIAHPGAMTGVVTITGKYVSPMGPQFNLITSVVYNVNTNLWSIGNSQLGIATLLG